ncbi:MAG: hypothetical protein KF752_03135 [Pirellulaceae bacterium]|nr:hypothetical protein [Pirellulaceae bacterium]
MKVGQYQSPPEIAKQLRVSCDRVLHWINTGKLKAVNLSEGHERPRWKVSPDDLSCFLKTRSNLADISPATERRVTIKPRRQHV